MRNILPQENQNSHPVHVSHHPHPKLSLLQQPKFSLMCKQLVFLTEVLPGWAVRMSSGPQNRKKKQRTVLHWSTERGTEVLASFGLRCLLRMKGSQNDPDSMHKKQRIWLDCVVLQIVISIKMRKNLKFPACVGLPSNRSFQNGFGDIFRSKHIFSQNNFRLNWCVTHNGKVDI